eukprot:3568763-Pyramimonas_sp.AAC.1
MRAEYQLAQALVKCLNSIERKKEGRQLACCSYLLICAKFESSMICPLYPAYLHMVENPAKGGRNGATWARDKALDLLPN